MGLGELRKELGKQLQQKAVAGVPTSASISATLVSSMTQLQADVIKLQADVAGIKAVLGLGALEARQMELRRVNRIIAPDELLCPLPNGGPVFPPAFWPAAGLNTLDIALLPAAHVNAMLDGYGLVLTGTAADRYQALLHHLCG